MTGNIEIEQGLLGVLILKNQEVDRLDGLLKPSHFSEPVHGRIFEAIEHLFLSQNSVTPLTLAASMQADAGLSSLGGIEYLIGLADASPVIYSAKSLAESIYDAAIRKKLSQVGEDIISSTHLPILEKTPAKLIEDAERALYEISDGRRFGSGVQDLSNGLTEVLASAQRAQRRSGRISGVTTGFLDLDALLGGLQPSDLLIVAGRPGMGKTSLAVNMAFRAAASYQHDIANGVEIPRGSPVLFFSLEMASQQLAARILSEQTEIEMWKIRDGKLTDSEWDKFVLATQTLAKIPIYIDDTGAISISQIAARARRMKREKNIGAIFIDYLQLVTSSRRENRVQEVTEITTGLKALAKELNIPIVALSQLSRGVDAREDKRPVLSDLRESGSIEQDADVVMFVYREEYYLKTREPDPASADHSKWMEKMERAHNRAEVLIEKHRHGPTAKVELFFDDRFTRFSDMVH